MVRYTDSENQKGMNDLHSYEHLNNCLKRQRKTNEMKKDKDGTELDKTV